MKNFEIKQKKGFLSAGFSVLLIAAVIVLNLFLSHKNYTVDLTEDRLYSLSEETDNIVDALEKDITIYIISSETQVSDDYDRVFQKYAQKKHITVEYKDPELYPNFTKDYVTDGEDVPNDSAIIVCGDKSRYISSYDYVSYSYDSNYNLQADSLDIERLFTQAICYVTEEETPVIYTLTGHGESDIPDNMNQRFEGVNYSVKSLSLLSEGKVPDDCSVLMINGPTKDISSKEKEYIEEYLNNGGKQYIFLNTSAGKLKNLYALLEQYKIGVTDGVIIENNSQNYMQYPFYLLPNIQSTDVTSAQYNKNVYILAISAKGLTDLSQDDEGDYTVEELLTTSEDAYVKVDTTSSTYEKEKNDVDGPFAVAILSENTNGGKMIVCGSANLMAAEVDEYVSEGNTDFILNGVNYLTEQEQKISIRNASITKDTIIVPAFYQKMILVASIFVVPLLFLLVGIGMIFHRRKL